MPRLATGLPLSHRRRTLRAYNICIDSRRKYTGVRSCKKTLSKVYVSDPLYLHESQAKVEGNVVFRDPLRLYAVLFTKISFGGFAFSSIMRYRWPTSMKGAQ